jgi:hypothetical protein
MPKDPKRVKRLSSQQCLIALLGTALQKAARKMLVKSISRRRALVPVVPRRQLLQFFGL